MEMEGLGEVESQEREARFRRSKMKCHYSGEKSLRVAGAVATVGAADIELPVVGSASKSSMPPLES